MENRRNVVYLLLILALLTGLFTGRAFFFNLSYMLGGLLLISLVWSWVAVRGLAIRRRTRSTRAQVGRNLEEDFIVRNTGWLPKLWLEVMDHSDLPHHRASQVVPALGARSGYRWHTETLCIARGEFQLGPMTLTSGDPFGLYVAQRQLEATSRIIVYPAISQINNFDLPMGMLSGGEAQRRRSHYVTTNAAGVRDYVPGDSFNRIHWRSTARKNQLIVKEFEIDPLMDIWLFTDFSRDSLVEDPSIRRMHDNGPIIPTSSGIPPATEEYVAVAGASLARYFITLERTIGFVTYAPNREVHRPERGHRQLTNVLESLAVARSLSERTLGQMLTLETPYLSRGTTLIIITSSVNKEWVREAQILSRRGIRIACVFIDPNSFNDEISSEETQGLLRIAKIPTVVIRHGMDIGEALSRRSF